MSENGRSAADKIICGLEQARDHAIMVDCARRYLAPFLAKEGLTGQLLSRQAAKVYDAAVNALIANGQSEATK